MTTDFPSRQTPADFPTPASSPRRKTPWWIPPVVVLGLLALATLLSVLLPSDTPPIGLPRLTFPRIDLTLQTAQHKPAVLLLELGDLPEWHQPSLGELFGATPHVTFCDALTALQIAQHDPNIGGLYLRLTGSTLGWARQEELWDAIDAFRRSGKFVYAYLEFGSEGEYALALAADSIFMPREGLLELNGFAALGLFFPGLLQKLGVEYYVEQFEEYKAAGEPLARRSFSPAARENLRDLLQHRYRRFVSRIEQRRGIPETTLRQRVFRQGLQEPDSLQAWGLIDGIVHETELLTLMARRLQLRDTAQIHKHLLRFGRYLTSSAVRRWKQKAAQRPAIALVYGLGAIVPGKADPWSEPQIAAEDFIKTLRAAADDEDVGAIILRIDSPGGSVLASDAIWTELRRIAQRKPIYASMGDVAASGGYYLALGCDTLIAHPSTLTGSIGVILALPNVAGTLHKLGLEADTVLTNPEAFFAHPFFPYEKAAKQRIHAIAHGIYERFLEKVALRRQMDREQVRKRARGRVWTGEEAWHLGLVDTLGGLSTALALAKQRLAIPEDQPVALRIFPRHKTPWELFLELVNSEETAAEGRSTVAQSVSVLPPRLRSVARYVLQLWHISLREPVMMALPWWMVSQ